jgi:hypothetical protein
MILRTELRRSTAPVAGIGLLVGSIWLLYALTGPWIHGTAPWNEQWTGLAQWTRSLMMFLWPLVLGVGAWQGLRDHRSRVRELFSTTPKPAWRRVLPTAAALALSLTAAYVVLLVVGGVQVAATANYFHLKWVPVAAVMVLALVGSALLGAGIGRLLPSLVTPPVVAVLALGLVVVAVQSDSLLLTPAFQSVHVSVFTTVAVPVTLAQALWFLGFGLTGFGLLFAAGIVARVVAVLPLAVAAAVAVPVLSTTHDPVIADRGATALVCDENGPRVCVTRAHEDYLPAFTGPARNALALLKKLPSPPTSVVEQSTPERVRPAPGEVPVFFEPMPRRNTEDILRWKVLYGAVDSGCQFDENADVDVIAQVTMAQIIVTSWLTGASTPVTAPGEEWQLETAHPNLDQEWAALMALPAEQQAARVDEIRQAALDCRPLGTR